LKTSPRFCPASLSLSRDRKKVVNIYCEYQPRSLVEVDKKGNL